MCLVVSCWYHDQKELQYQCWLFEKSRKREISSQQHRFVDSLLPHWSLANLQAWNWGQGTLFTRQLTSASDFMDVPESLQFISISTDSFRWTGDGDGGRINTGSVPPTRWRSSSGTKESGSKEGQSRYSCSKPKEFVAVHSRLRTIKHRQGNAAVSCSSSSSSGRKGSGLKSSYRAGSW